MITAALAADAASDNRSQLVRTKQLTDEVVPAVAALAGDIGDQSSVKFDADTKQNVAACRK